MDWGEDCCVTGTPGMLDAVMPVPSVGRRNPSRGWEQMGSHCFAGRMLASRPLDESLWMQAKAYGNGFIHPVHHRAIYPAHVLPQTLFVQRPDLF